MASGRSRLLWEAGVPLGDSWTEFAPAELLADYTQAPGLLESLIHHVEHAASDLNKLPNALLDAVSAARKKTDAERALKEELLDSLFNGELFAYGYRVKPSLSGAPVEIQSDIFNDCEPDWERNLLIGLGRRFDQVRIVDPRLMGEHAATTAPAKGSKAAIAEALDALAITTNLCGVDRKVACEMVRAYFAANNVSIAQRGNGLSNQNISKAIVRKCGHRRINN